MSLRTQIAQALGKRVTIRLRDSDGGLRDVVGVLQSETELVNRRGEIITFDPDTAVAFRVIPVFNRRDISSGSLSMYDTMSRTLKEISGRDGAVRIYCCGPTVYRDAHVGNLRTFLLGDLITRLAKYLGFEVNFIQNITDVGQADGNDCRADTKRWLDWLYRANRGQVRRQNRRIAGANL